MTDDIYDPLDEYVNTFQPRFEQVAKDTFAQLAKEAQVDVDANRQTCRLLYDAEKSLGAVKSRIGWTTFLCVILWCCAAIGIFAICKDYGTMSPAIATAVLLSVLAAVILLLSVIHPRLKRLKAERGDLKQTIAQHKDEAWEQMAPLNRLYDWDVLTRMMTETVPRLEFDPYFTEQRLANLRQVYGWDDTFNAVVRLSTPIPALSTAIRSCFAARARWRWAQRHITATKPSIGPHANMAQTAR